MYIEFIHISLYRHMYTVLACCTDTEPRPTFTTVAPVSCSEVTKPATVGSVRSTSKS